jgi:hypothetical protein
MPKKGLYSVDLEREVLEIDKIPKCNFQYKFNFVKEKIA